MLRADCQVSAAATRQATPCLHVRERVCEHGADHSWCDNFRRERHEGRPGYHGEGEGEGYHGEGEGEGYHGEGEGDGYHGEGEGDGYHGEGMAIMQKENEKAITQKENENEKAIMQKENEKGMAIMQKENEKAIMQKENENEKAIMQKENEKGMAIMQKENEKGMAIIEMENSAAVRYRHLQYKYLSVSSRFWLEQLFSDFQKFVQSRFSWKAERSMTKINKFLVNNDTIWQQFVANESLSLTPPVNESFPSIPDTILYGALSEKVHQPPGLAVLNLTDPPYTEHVYLLRDLGVHYSKKLNLVCESVDLSQAIGDLMRRDLK